MNEKNYYELLEIDKNASQEIIEKAYKTLVKKYHPDIQNNVSDEIIKKIIEAYEIISDPQKRSEYDKKLSSELVSKEDYNRLNLEYKLLQKQNEELSDKIEDLLNSNINQIPNQTTPKHTTSIYKNNDFYNTVSQPTNPNFQDFSKAKTYRTHYTMQDNSPIKNILSLFITIVLVLAITYILWIIPFTHDYLVSIYQNNIVIQTLVDIFIK